jgi:tetratricopeptide (TPR) repeat protein
MPGMTAHEIWTALAENEHAPNGPIRIARAEYLVDAAEACGDSPVYAQALIDVINAYEYGAEQSKLLVPFAQLLRLWDRDGAAFDQRRRHFLFWYFKWATGGMVSVPEVPLASIEGWLGEMESRYRQAGHSPRPVHMGRHRLARATGDEPAADREFEAWLDAPRDSMADCNACEAGDQGWWHAFNGRDEQALNQWRPVLDGELTCAEEPHRVLSHSLLPLVRLGRIDEARANHLRGYRMARGVANLRSTIARHIEFCALTGNEARGLEILTEHAAFLAPGAEDADSRLDFLTGTLILLRRLSVLDLGDLELGGSTVTNTAESVQEQISELCGRFDARNGNTIVTERTQERLAREPLIESLPLGSSSVLPQREGTGRNVAIGPAAGTASARTDANSAPVLDELVATAERLTDQRHPHARQAWERVGALGGQLPARIAARVGRSKAIAMMERQPAAARAALTELAARFDELGEPGETWETRSTATFAAFLAGDRDAAESEAVVIGAEAEAAYAAGELTARQYLGARGLPAYIAFNDFARQAESSDEQSEAGADIALDAAPGTESDSPDSDPPESEFESDSEPEPLDPSGAIRLISAELELAEKLGDPGRAAVYHRMLAQLAFFQQQPGDAVAHLEASRDGFLTSGQIWDAAEPEGLLAQVAMQSGDPAIAERLTRDALAHGADVISAQDRARFSSLLVEALSRQRERQLDLVDAALRAAELWEGLSEPDTLHNRFTAASAYASLDRYGEAAALFDELMPRVHVPYDDAGIAMRREQYGDCLTQLGEHRKAAEQYVAAAALVQDDPHNQVAHARVAWSAAQALQSAGLFSEALPAYRRVAELWGELGNTPARVRCLRSAAWLVGWESGWTEALGQMRAVLAELRSVPENQRSDAIEAEVRYTADQIDQMLANLSDNDPGGAGRHPADDAG